MQVIGVVIHKVLHLVVGILKPGTPFPPHFKENMLLLLTIMTGSSKISYGSGHTRLKDTPLRNG